VTGGRTPGLDELFRPESVAVVGASNRPGSVGQSLFRNVLASEFQGVVYPVNPSWKSVSGVRCFARVEDLPEAPDLAVVIVPAAAVPRVVEQLGRRGTRGVVVISAGFREIGGTGIPLEAKLVAAARKHRMALVGPNCFGVLNTDPAVSLNATFSEDLPPRGNIAFVSQSGALCAGILRYGVAERIGFSRFVSVGNRAGIDENDLLRSLASDERTRVILLYMESLADGRRFLEAAREVTERKPVLIIKSGRSPLGERAALSHTGSLARSGQDRLYDAVFEQSGVLRADTIGELFRMAKVFGTDLKVSGPGLAILTNSGGPGIVAADAASRQGLELPPLPDETIATLRRFLSPSAAFANPLDMTADASADAYGRSLRELLSLPKVHAALVIATPVGHASASAVAEAILRARSAVTKPVVACLFGLTDLSHEVGHLEEQGIPTFTFPEEAVAGLGSLARYHAWWTRPRTRVREFAVDRPRARAAIRAAHRLSSPLVPANVSRELLEAYGIPFPGFELVQSVDAALQAADRLRFPVALKVVSAEIPHKTEVGGVALHLAGEDELRAAWQTMAKSLSIRAPNARIEGFEVQAMVPSGKEVLVGIQRDPAFGPIVVFGLGGIYVEVLKDVTFRLAPLRPLSAQHMVASVRAYPLLTGVRGEPPSDLRALYETIERVSQLAVENPEVTELDINPLVVRPAGHGVVAVDSRVVLGPSSRSGSRASGGGSDTPPPRTRRAGAARRRRR
jgi:acetyl coenzyme A synthetase (ADP forming)-like protein